MADIVFVVTFVAMVCGGGPAATLEENQTISGNFSLGMFLLAANEKSYYSAGLSLSNDKYSKSGHCFLILMIVLFFGSFIFIDASCVCGRLWLESRFATSSVARRIRATARRTNRFRNDCVTACL